MATPLKPWEIKGGGLTPRTEGRKLAPGGGSGAASRTPGPGTGPSPPPAVPPRPANAATGTQRTYYSPSYQGFGSYGGLGYRPMGLYGAGYGGYGGYGAGYGGYGSYGGFGGYGMEESQIMRQAEERARSTFQSVETVVGAFTSVTMMLESTYFAVHSCFRALVGVAQHFTRLRNHIWGILTALALLRRLRYWLKRLLRWLHLRQMPPSEELWEEVSLESAAASSPAGLGSRLWPVVMFFSVVFGVPWLLWRLLTFLLQSEDSSDASRNWSSSEGQTLVARALYDFTSGNPDELTVSAGDELVLAPRQLQTGWLLVGKNRTSGLVPANYVQIVQPGGGTNSGGDSHRPSSSGPVPSSPSSSPSPSQPRQLATSEEEALLTD